MQIKYSIIIPFFNGENHYGTLLNSIAIAVRKLNTSDIKFELITIIDSMETSEELIENMTSRIFDTSNNIKILVLKNESNIGVAGSRNRGIEISSGRYLHLIDQDDEVSTDFYILCEQYSVEYNFLLFNGEVRFKNKTINSHKLYYVAPILSLENLIIDDFIRSPGQVVFAKKLLKEYDYFQEPKNFKGADDRFFWLKIFFQNEGNLLSKFIYNPCYLANIHEENYSNDRINLDKSCLENWRIFKSKHDFHKFNYLIEKDILRVRFRLKEKMSLFQWIFGLYLYLSYNFKINKILRYIIKRV